jgi:hypothetical protein
MAFGKRVRDTSDKGVSRESALSEKLMTDDQLRKRDMGLRRRIGSSSGGATAQGSAPPEKPQTDDDASWGRTRLIGVTVFVAIVAGGVFLRFPRSFPISLPVFGVSAPRVSYSAFDLVEGGSTFVAADSETEASLGLDFSIILTPWSLETSNVMKMVAFACLPQEEFEQRSMPTKAHGTFAQATDYLACAMRRNKARLCHADYRQRLVAQLMQYRTLRQHMFGIERARERALEELASDPLGKVMELQRKFEALSGMEKSPPASIPKIGQELDPRIAGGLTELNREGYISLSDFTWSGILGPAEYMPYLDRGEAGRICY